MSLFKAREWWSTTCGSEETFDSGCLLVAPLGPAGQHVQRIVVASHEGFIRVYQPHYEAPAAAADGGGDETGDVGFRPDDLLLEVQLDQPALHLTAGQFVGAGGDTCLAVLQPFQVSVFTVTTAAGAVEHGTQYSLNRAYSHRLKRSAFNMFSGRFSGAAGKEQFCVQSLDGTLTFFEQESAAFSRFLPGYLIPGPALFVAKSAAVVAATAAWTVDAYKYAALAQGAEPAQQRPAGGADAGDTGTGKRVYADWSYNLGELSLDIQQVALPTGETRLLVLAEHSLSILKETGQPLLFKRLDYSPSALACFVNAAGRLMSVVGSHTSVAHVYEGVTLRWAARLPCVPCAVGRLDLQHLHGLLVLLSSQGSLTAVYLGTTPSLFVAPPVQAAGVLDYEALDAELAELNGIIQRAQVDGEVPISGDESGLQLVVQIHPVLDPCSLPTEVQEQVPCASIRAMVTPTAPVSSALVSFHVLPPLTVSKPSAAFDHLTGTETVEAVVYLSLSHAVPSLLLETVVSYTINGGASRLLRATARLPLTLVAHGADPSRDAEHRVTISCLKPSLSLADLFADLGLDAAMCSAAAVQFYTGPLVTILASKTSQRYRLQSDDFHALWLVAEELVRRIDEHYASPVCSFAASLPLQELLVAADALLLWRHRRQQRHLQLTQRAAQLRAVQRRLLTKYRQPTPAPLANMDQLLEETYRGLLTEAEQAMDDERSLASCAAQLSCAVQLVLLLTRLSRSMDEHEFTLLEAALNWRCEGTDEQGWHETVDTAAAFLHRRIQSRDSRPELPPAPPTMPENTHKLKRHLGLLLDKLVKADGKIGDAVAEEDGDGWADERSTPVSQVLTQRLAPTRPRTGSARPRTAASAVALSVDPPTPQPRRAAGRPASADSVDAEASAETDSAGAADDVLRPLPAAQRRVAANNDAAGDVQRLIPHGLTEGLTESRIEAPRRGLLDEPEEEDFW